MPIVLTSQGIVQTPLKAGEFLKKNAFGPYTSLTVLKNGHVPHWNEHLQRLQQSLSARCTASQASRWRSQPWTIHQMRHSIIELDLCAKVQDAANAVRSGDGNDTDVSVVLLLLQTAG